MSVEKYWQIGTNKWERSRFSWEQAQKLNKTLIDCEYCTNCAYCEQCVNCEDCMFCCECADCVQCNFYSLCMDCKKCDYFDACSYIGTKNINWGYILVGLSIFNIVLIFANAFL